MRNAGVVVGKKFMCLLLLNVLLRDAMPINLEAFFLWVDVRAQGNITGQLENKTCLMQFERAFFFFPWEKQKSQCRLSITGITANFCS